MGGNTGIRQLASKAGTKKKSRNKNQKGRSKYRKQGAKTRDQLKPITIQSVDLSGSAKLKGWNQHLKLWKHRKIQVLIRS